jgi:hypothetical protein
MNKIIHIGANKAASTTLQRHLFNKSEYLSYLGEDCIDYHKYKVCLDSLVSDDDFHFSFIDAEKIFHKQIENSHKKTFIFSNEDILTSRVPTQCATRLHKLLPDAKILIIIRNQLDAIVSWYANHGAYLKQVPRNYWRRYVSFDDWLEYCFSYPKYSPLESYLYHKHLTLYRDLFGKDNIHILFFEDLIYKKKTFIEGLSNILNVKYSNVADALVNKQERPRNTIRQHRYNQFTSNFFYNTSLVKFIPFAKYTKNIWSKYLLSGDKVKVILSERWKNMLVDYFAEDNNQLSLEYSIDINRYNYPK